MGGGEQIAPCLSSSLIYNILPHFENSPCVRASTIHTAKTYCNIEIEFLKTALQIINDNGRVGEKLLFCTCLLHGGLIKPACVCMDYESVCNLQHAQHFFIVTFFLLIRSV